MSLDKSLKSIIVPEASDFDFQTLDVLFNHLFKSDGDIKTMRNFIRELLQVLNVYDFEFVKFTFDEENNIYKCYLSNYEIFNISSKGLVVFVDPLPMAQDIKKEIIALTNQTNQSNPNLTKNYGSNVVMLHCNPLYLSDLEDQFLKGFRYLVSRLMENSFDPIELEHSLEFLKYFDLEFLLEEPTKNIESTISENLEILNGETDLIEYKPSIYWSDRSKKDLTNTSQNEVLRTLNGFMNSRGGVLIIGIHDSEKESRYLEKDSNQNIVMKDFQEEFYSFKDYDNFLLELYNLLKKAFGSVAMQLCKIEKINLGPGLVFNSQQTPMKHMERWVNYDQDRVLIQITVEESKTPVFVDLLPLVCKNHNCNNCLGPSQSIKGGSADFKNLFFVRTPTSATEQYEFGKVISYISSKFPKYFNFISDESSD